MLEIFKSNLAFWIAKREISRAELSRKAGYNQNKVTAILNGASMPSISVAVRFAAVLGISANDLLYPRPEIGVEFQDGDRSWQDRGADSAISNHLNRQVGEDTKGSITEFLLDWQGATNGDLGELGDIRQKIELFGSPDACLMLPKPIEVGKASLAATVFGIENAEHLEKMFRASDKTIATAVAESHFKALSGEAKVDYFRMNVVEDGKVIYGVDYRRILMRGFDRAPGGSNTYVLNYSQPIWYFGQSHGEPLKLRPGGKQQPVLSKLSARSDGPAVGALKDFG